MENSVKMRGRVPRLLASIVSRLAEIRLLFFRRQAMNIILFAVIHILIGLGFIYFFGELPKGIVTFVVTFLTMSFIYFAFAFSGFFF